MYGVHHILTAAAGGLDLSTTFTNFSTWTLGNLGPVAGIIMIIGFIILAFGGFSAKWGQKAVQILKYPVIAVFGFAFLPTMFSLFFTLVAAFGGTTNTIANP